MKKTVPRKLEEARELVGPMASDASYGMAGAFKFKTMSIISSGVDHEGGWEHVSVSLPGRVPTWSEMCWVKDLFWHEDEVVVQYHPMKKDYVNFHPYCLHLWKPLNAVMPVPPSLLVGPKT